MLMFPVLAIIVSIGNKVSGTDHDFSLVSEAQARQLTVEEQAIYRARVAKKRKTAEFERRKAAAEEQVRLNDLKDSPAYQRRFHQARQRAVEKMARDRKMAQAASNNIKLRTGGKHNTLIMAYFAKLEGKKAEVKKHLAEMQVLQRTFNQLVQEKIQSEPDVDLSRLLSLSEPNYIDDPNTVTIEIVKETVPKRVTPKQAKTPVKIITEIPVKKETETMFIDLTN